MEKPKDYYQLLGVPRDASLNAIKRAFKRLARRYDPARTEGATDTFAELQHYLLPQSMIPIPIPSVWDSDQYSVQHR